MGVDGVDAEVADAVGNGETTGVEAGLVRARRAVDPGGLRVLGREEFRELRAEDCEGGHAEERGEVAGAGVVADETVGRGEQVEQGVEGG